MPAKEKQFYDHKVVEFGTHVSNATKDYAKREVLFAAKNAKKAKQENTGTQEFNKNYSSIENEDGTLKDMTALLRKAAAEGNTDEAEAGRYGSTKNTVKG